MAIIPRYTSRALPPGAQPGLTTSALSRGAAGAGLARAAGRAAVAGTKYKQRKDADEALVEAARRREQGEAKARTGAAAKIASRIAAEKRRNGDLDHQNGVAALAWAEAAITKQRASGHVSAKTDGGPAKGMTQRALAKFDGATGKLSEGLADQPHLKARFDAMVASSRAPHELRMLTVENARRAGDEKAVLADALNELALAAVADPAMAPGVTGRGLAQIEGAMEAGMLAPEEAAGMQRDFADRVHMAAMRGQIAADPEDALARLESGEFDDIFEAAARDRLIGEARTTARMKAAGASAAARARRRGLEIDMAAYLEDVAETGAGDEGVAARAQADLPEFQHAAFQASQAQARERFATRAEYAFMTAEEVEADIAKQAPGGGPRGTDEHDAAHAIRTEIRDEVLAARVADPAGWAMRDDDVAAAFAAAETALESAEPGTPAMARAEQAYRRALAARDALQRDMGVEKTRLMSQMELDGIAGRLAGMSPSERRAELHRLWKRHDGEYGRLLAEFGGEIDADTALLAQYAMHPRLAELLAKGMGKARANGPAKAKGDVPLLPATLRPDETDSPGDMGRMRTFHQYVMPGGERVEYDGEALVPVAAVQMAAPQSLPGGATLWPGAKSQPTPTDWAGVGKSIGKALPRVGAAAGTVLSVLLTPMNAQKEYHSFGEGGAMRLRTAPGDLLGSVERLDPDTGEWEATELVGFIMGGGAGNLPSIVAGTPEQVGRAGRAEPMAVPDGQLPPPPGLVPPIVPDMGEETFPAEEGRPVIHVTPEAETRTDIEAFPIPESGEPQILVFPDMSQELASFMVLENRKGNAATKAHIDSVRNWFREQYPEWKHVDGGRDRKDGSEKKEYWVPGPGIAFPDEVGREGDGRPGGKWADLTFKTPSGTLVHIQTVDVDKYGKPTERELENAEAIRQATRHTVILIPKPTRK